MKQISGMSFGIALSIVVAMLTSASVFAADVSSMVRLYVPSAPNMEMSDYLAIVFQEGRVRTLICKRPLDIPDSPDELSAYIHSKCKSINELPFPPNWEVHRVTHVVRQSRSKRYITQFTSVVTPLGQDANFNGYSSIVSLTSVFNDGDPSSIQLLATATMVKEDHNPELLTQRFSFLRAYETAIPYPEITERPIEQ